MSENMTKDNNTSKKIRPTDNRLKEGDHESLQVTRPLTDEEIQALLKEADAK